MCQTNESPIKHTHKDHIVYKLVCVQTIDGDYFSSFFHTRYRLGQKYELPSDTLDRGTNSDVQPGYHFFTSLKAAYKYKCVNDRILKCIIPTGSVYRTGILFGPLDEYKTLRTNQFTPIEEVV